MSNIKIEQDETALDVTKGEVEIIEFTIDSAAFGVDVSKIREILIPMEVKSMPHAHPAVEGVFKPRDAVITVINLPLYLEKKPSPSDNKDLFVITNSNNMHVAFRVHSVVGIHRMKKADIKEPDPTIYGGADGTAIGIADCKKHLITILDFEKIVREISEEQLKKKECEETDSE